jgi:tetratricopeptide (TPR) repeat protein
LAEKIDRKQLKKPDEFQVVAGHAMEWVAAHQRPVALAAGAVVLAALLAWGLAAWRGSREAAAGAQLAEALELQSRPIAGEAAAQPGVETFASKEERDKAALEALEKVRAGHGGTAAGTTAIAEIGFLKLKLGDGAGAQKELSDFLQAARKDHPLRVFAQESLGYAFEAQGKLDEAKAAFEKLRELDMPARADYQSARLLLVQGKPEAKQQLERVAKEYPKDLDVVRAAYERLELAALPPFKPGDPVAPAAAPEKAAAAAPPASKKAAPTAKKPPKKTK